jgi:hypothetical protein
VRKHQPMFGMKENQPNIHRDARKIRARSEATQPFIVYWALVTEAFCKLLKNLYLRRSKEGCEIMWSIIINSIQTHGKFKGLLKLNLRNVFDKKMQLSLDNTSVRMDEDPFDVLEDPSDEKCLVILVIHLANMTNENASRVFCYLGKSKSFIKEMQQAGTPHIKVDWRKKIGHNTMGKSTKYLANKTGFPMPTKGQMGAHGLRHGALTGLKEHGVCDFKTKLTFHHESDKAHLMYPESELKMQKQKYAAQMLKGKTVWKRY